MRVRSDQGTLFSLVKELLEKGDHLLISGFGKSFVGAIKGDCDHMQEPDSIETILHDMPQQLLAALLDNPYECLILVDAEGIVRFMSTATRGIYPILPEDAVGRHITEVSPQSKLTRVLETGKAEIGTGMMLKDNQRVIARIPLTRDGRIVGAFGKLMFKTPARLKEFV